MAQPIFLEIHMIQTSHTNELFGVADGPAFLWGKEWPTKIEPL